MSDSETDPVLTTPELVGLLHSRAEFEAAVAALEQAGFDRTDISVLSTHDSLDAAGTPPARWRDAVTALFGDLKYEGPLVSAGFIALAAGPVGAAIAGVVGAGVGVAAVREVLGEVTATPHTEDFARSLQAGSLILWVRLPEAEAETRARAALEGAGASDIHRVPAA